MSGFGFARGFVRVIEVVAWVVAVLAFLRGAAAMSERRPEEGALVAGFLLAAAAVTLLGAQMARAQIVTAESAAEIAALLRGKFTQDIPAGASAIYEERNGVTIYRAGPGAFLADGQRFDRIDAARAYADGKS